MTWSRPYSISNAMDILQVGALGIAAALCALVVKQKAQDIGTVLALAACAALMVSILPAFEEIKLMILSMGELAGLSEVIITPVMKTVGIAIVTKLAAEVCRDAKENGIASFVELAGATAALLLALPLLNMLLELIGGLL